MRSARMPLLPRKMAEAAQGAGLGGLVIGSSQGVIIKVVS